MHCCVNNKIVTLSNSLMFITSTTTGIMEVYSRTKLYRKHASYKGTEAWLIS